MVLYVFESLCKAKKNPPPPPLTSPKAVKCAEKGVFSFCELRSLTF